MRLDIGWPVGSAIAATLSFYAVSTVTLSHSLPFLTRSEGGTEIATAVAYLAAAVIAGSAARYMNRPASLWLWLWAVLAVVFFGEETSWLQHVFDYRTPAFLSEMNAQGEVNLHNLSILSDGDLLEVGGVGDFASAMIKSQNLFRIGFTAFFLIIPLVALASARAAKVASRCGLPYPGTRFLVVIWAPILVTIALTRLADDRPERFAAAETRELCYAVAIFVYVLVARRASSVTPAARR